MAINYAKDKTGAFVASYQTRRTSNVENLVRTSLNMQLAQPKKPTEIVPGREAYIIDGPNATVYHTPFTDLVETTCTVTVPKSGKPILVEVKSRINMAEEGLKVLLENGYIKPKLFSSGLVAE
jgi:hypothetical protein